MATKKVKIKPIEVVLLPKDFIGNKYLDTHDCPLARAIKRHFKVKDVSIGSSTLFFYDTSEEFKIVNRFDMEDHDMVKEAYAKDPKMTKGYYVVKLIPD